MQVPGSCCCIYAERRSSSTTIDISTQNTIDSNQLSYSPFPQVSKTPTNEPSTEDVVQRANELLTRRRAFIEKHGSIAEEFQFPREDEAKLDDFIEQHKRLRQSIKPVSEQTAHLNMAQYREEFSTGMVEAKQAYGEALKLAEEVKRHQSDGEDDLK